jgi:hypothetical protein
MVRSSANRFWHISLIDVIWLLLGFCFLALIATIVWWDSTDVERQTARLKSSDRAGRYAASEELVKIGQRAVVPLTVALKDPDPDIRWHAAWALWSIKDPRAVEPLIGSLEDSNSVTRGISAKALGQLEDPRAIKPLIVTLKDSDPAVQKEAIVALGNIGIPAVEPLIDAMKDPDIRWRPGQVWPGYMNELSDVISRQCEGTSGPLSSRKTVRSRRMDCCR